MFQKIIHLSLSNLKNRLIPCKCYWPRSILKLSILRKYEEYIGHKCNLKDPVLFTEKIQWYKLFYDTPNLKNIIDKASFKEFVRQQIGDGHTIPLIRVWDDITELKQDWDILPEKVCLKSTISGGGNNIRLLTNRSMIDKNVIFRELNGWFNEKNTNLNSTIAGYYDCVPRVLAEEYMTQIDNQLYDYKFFCFSGKPYCVYVATDHFPGQLSRISFYDLNWNRMNVQYGKHPNCDIEKPRHFEEMLGLATKLSSGFPFVRVDFFETDNEPYVAEMTFFPGNGFTPYYPESFNKELGDLFILPDKYEPKKKQNV